MINSLLPCCLKYALQTPLWHAEVMAQFQDHGVSLIKGFEDISNQNLFANYD